LVTARFGYGAGDLRPRIYQVDCGMLGRRWQYSEAVGPKSGDFGYTATSAKCARVARDVPLAANGATVEFHIDRARFAIRISQFD
jgi:hypothetical protein